MRNLRTNTHGYSKGKNIGIDWIIGVDLGNNGFSWYLGLVRIKNTWRYDQVPGFDSQQAHGR